MSELTAGALAVLVSALILALQHWAARSLLRKPLPTPINYIIGSLGILAGYFMWCWLMGDLTPVARLVVLYVFAGGLVVAMYLLESATALRDALARADFLDAKHTGEDDETS